MKVWKFGDNVDTDQIIPAEYLTTADEKKLAKHVFAKVRPELAVDVSEGDFIVGGANFGSGSSREHAPLALKGSGIVCVIAKSFARIFFRNSINIGFPLIELDILDETEEGHQLKIVFDKGIVINESTGRSYTFPSLPPFVEKIIESGGLIPYTREKFKK